MKRLMAFLLLCILAGQATAAGLFARVDRTQLSIDETLELSLESQGGAVFGKPDLEPLEELFEVFDTRQVNQLSSSNGEARAITRWLITLRPRQTGYVVIPPLQLGDWRSEPITLLVQESLKSSEGDQLAPIFIDSSVDQESVYVQAQVILTLRIYHSVSLYDDSTLSPLQMPEALVERLGEPRTYEKTINGIRHGVIEVRYALFPQKSGELTIPAQLFSATTVTNGSNSVFGSRGVPVHPGPLAEHPADGQGQTGRLSSRRALAAGAQPDAGRSLEPGAAAGPGRRIAHPQPAAQGRGADQHAAAGDRLHTERRTAPLPGPAQPGQRGQLSRPGWQSRTARSLDPHPQRAIAVACSRSRLVEHRRRSPGAHHARGAYAGCRGQSESPRQRPNHRCCQQYPPNRPCSGRGS